MSPFIRGRTETQTQMCDKRFYSKTSLFYLKKKKENSATDKNTPVVVSKAQTQGIIPRYKPVRLNNKLSCNFPRERRKRENPLDKKKIEVKQSYLLAEESKRPLRLSFDSRQ